MPPYLSLRAETCFAELPAVINVELRYNMTKVLVTVTSQIKFIPASQGVRVRLSNRFPSECNGPVGSLKEKVPA